MSVLKGYKTVAFMGFSLVVALVQYFGGPLPAVDPQVWAIAVPAVGLVLRLITDTPVGVSGGK